MIRKLLIGLAVVAASATAAKTVYATMMEEGAEAAADIKSAWKDTSGFCPAACDASQYKCPCVVITSAN